MEPEPEILVVQNIRTRFGTQEVHKDVSFNLRRGDVTALIGGSGTGKSVLLKEILGLLRPSAGTIRIFGRDVLHERGSEIEALRMRYGVLFQNGALFSGLSVGQNVSVPFTEQLRLPRKLAEELVALRLALSGLSPEVSRKMPSELSGGMRKRAALARALALEPELLFLDEPTSGLDPVHARAFDALIRTLADGIRLTVLLVTHDLDTLAGIVDRIIVLGEGRVIGDGSYEEVRRSSDAWIQSYFNARVVSRKGG